MHAGFTAVQFPPRNRDVDEARPGARNHEVRSSGGGGGPIPLPPFGEGWKGCDERHRRHAAPLSERRAGKVGRRQTFLAVQPTAYDLSFVGPVEHRNMNARLAHDWL